MDKRYRTADEMHEAVYACLVSKGEKVLRPVPPHAHTPKAKSVGPSPGSTQPLPFAPLLAFALSFAR